MFAEKTDRTISITGNHCAQDFFMLSQDAVTSQRASSLHHAQMNLSTDRRVDTTEPWTLHGINKGGVKLEVRKNEVAVWRIKRYLAQVFD